MDINLYPIQVLNTIKMLGSDESLMILSAFVIRQHDGAKEHTMLKWGISKELTNNTSSNDDGIVFSTYDTENDVDKLFVATKLCALLEIPQVGIDKIALKVYKRGNDKVLFVSVQPETVFIKAEGWDLVYDEIVKSEDAKTYITPKPEFYIKDTVHKGKIRFPDKFYPLFCMDSTTNMLAGDFGYREIIVSTIENIQAGSSNKYRTYIL